MIKQYIKLFLESNEESQKKRPTFHDILASKFDSGVNANQDPSQNSEENEDNNTNNNDELNADETGMAWLLRNNK